MDLGTVFEENSSHVSEAVRIYHSDIGVNVQCEECGGGLAIFNSIQRRLNILRYYYMKRSASGILRITTMAAGLKF